MMRLNLLFVLFFYNYSSASGVKLIHPKMLEINAQVLGKKSIEELGQKKECPTLPTIRATTPIRRKCFEMCAKAGIALPQLVYVGVDNTLNKETYASVDNIQNHKGKVCAIKFHPATFRCAHGVQECIWLHEAAHIIHDHLLKPARNRKDYPNIQKEEREADFGALHTAKCKQCVLEWAQFFYALARLNIGDYRFSERLHWTLQLNTSLSKFCEQNAKILYESLFALQNASTKRPSTHPLYLERALSAYLFTQKEKQMCAFHARYEVEKNKTKNVVLPVMTKSLHPTTKSQRIVHKRPKPIKISQRSDPISWGVCGNKMRIGNRWFYSG